MQPWLSTRTSAHKPCHRTIHSTLWLCKASFELCSCGESRERKRSRIAMSIMDIGFTVSPSPPRATSWLILPHTVDGKSSCGYDRISNFNTCEQQLSCTLKRWNQLNATCKSEKKTPGTLLYFASITKAIHHLCRADSKQNAKD